MQSHLLALALFALVAANSCSCEVTPLDYVRLPFFGFEEENELHYLRTEINENAGDSAHDVAQYIQQLYEEAIAYSRGEKGGNGPVLTYPGDKMRLYSLLDSLADFYNTDSPSRCGAQNVNTFMAVVDLVFGDIDNFVAYLWHRQEPESDTKLFRYLATYGVHTFQECMTTAHSLFEQKLAGVEGRYLNAFDDLVSNGDGDRYSEEQLAGMAREIDFSTDQYKRSMFSAIIKYVNADEYSQWRKSKSQVVKNFVTHACGYIRSSLGAAFDSYNLGVVFSGVRGQSMGDKFNKINEYNRLCLQIYSMDSGSGLGSSSGDSDTSSSSSDGEGKKKKKKVLGLF